MFKFWNAKFKMNWGYGHSVRPMKKETTSDIYIQTGEALTDEDAESTIERIVSTTRRICNNPIWHYQFKDIR